MIETVLGPITPDQLGATSMHEHVLSDARGLARLDDYALNDPELAAAELRHAAAAGLRTVVDPTGWGFGGPAPALPQVARACGVQIVAGVGVYLGRTRPAWLAELDRERLEESFLSALTDRLPGCSHRAGVLGVIAPDHPLGGQDETILAAAAGAAVHSASALILRLDPRYDDGPGLIARLVRHGLDPERLILSNIDGWASEPRLLRPLAETGATLKWCFGYEAPPRTGMRSATDDQRMQALCTLLEAGCERQVLACGVWTRSALRVNGGFGYDHLPARIVPALRARGLDQAAIDGLLIEQPRRLLDRGPLDRGPVTGA